MNRIYKLLTLMLLILSIFAANSYAKIPEKRPQGFINDYAGVLSDQNKHYLEALSRQIETQTSCELALITLKSLDGDTIEGYATAAFEKWGIGKKGQDNGVLVVFSLNDKKVRIEVGYGLEEFLTDGFCGEIIRQYMVPYFKKGDYTSGLTQGMLVVADQIGKKYNFSVPGKKSRYMSRGRGRSRRRGGLVKGIFSLLMLLLLFTGRMGFLPFLFLGGMSGRGGYWGGGNMSSGFGGGFGGFGGGMSGGGGASGGW